MGAHRYGSFCNLNSKHFSILRVSANALYDCYSRIVDSFIYMESALSLISLCIVSISAWLQGTPQGAHVWQGTEITYWHNERRNYIGITHWLPFFCQELRAGMGGGKSGDQPPKDVYNAHCDAGIDISRSLLYQMWVLRPSVPIAWGSKHQQTRKMNSELIRKKWR